MNIFPAIDLYDGKAVRLYKGDYAQMTVYSENPVDVARAFARLGASHIHLVDLEGAKTGTTPNLETICAIKRTTGLFCEVGGGNAGFDCEAVAKALVDKKYDKWILIEHDTHLNEPEVDLKVSADRLREWFK